MIQFIADGVSGQIPLEIKRLGTAYAVTIYDNNDTDNKDTSDEID